MNILEDIAIRTRKRIEEKKKRVTLDDLIQQMEKKGMGQSAGLKGGLGNGDPVLPFEQALRKEGMSFICEVKKASPSKGVIARDFPYRTIAKEYEAAGAGAISVLTEPFYFQGSDSYLSEIAGEVSIPLLRKDFTVDEYMVYEAKCMGASAVLFICAILSLEELTRYIGTARRLGLSALVEAHDDKEVEMALMAGAGIIGVNNRDLKTFEVNLSTSERLRKKIPNDKVFVSESGIRTSKDLERLRDIGVDAVLIGETLMRSGDKGEELRRLMGHNRQSMLPSLTTPSTKPTSVPAISTDTATS